MKTKPLDMETLQRDELDELQNKRLQYTLNKAYTHTVFWRKKFDDLGIKPDDIKNKEDLLKYYKRGLKITDKDIVFNFKDMCPDYSNESDYTILTTSGTSGNPKWICYGKDDMKRSDEIIGLILNIMGVSKGSRVMNKFAPTPNASGFLLLSAIKAVGASQFPLQINIPPKLILNILKSYNPQSMWALGSNVLNLGNFIKNTGGDPKKLGISAFGIGGEPFSKKLKEKAMKMWGAEIFDIYASAELSVAGFECQCNKGLHIAENRIFLTIVDKESMEEKDEGERGYILGTTLYDEGEYPHFFIINRETGDISKKLGVDCECGRTTLRIDYVRRDDDIFAIEAKKLDVRDIESMLGEDNFTGNYLVVKYTNENTGQVKKIQIRLEVKELLPPIITDNLITGVIDAFSTGNPLCYEVLKSLEKEKKIKVVLTDSKRLYEGFEEYMLPGKPKRIIEVDESSGNLFAN